MAELLKRDDALWLRHLRAAGIDVTLGEPVRLRVNGLEVDFEPMRPDRHGRKTHGLKATGRNAHQWHAIQRGATVFVELCGLERFEPVVDAGARVRRNDSLDATLPPSHDVSGRVLEPALRIGVDAAALPTGGAVVGVDVGYSESVASTGLCVLSWTGTLVTWACLNAHSDDAHRVTTLTSISPLNRRVAAAAIDGPLVPELASHSRYRACEAILSSGVLQKRGKPGQTNAGSGPRLHHEATRLGRFVLNQLEIGIATHSCRIHAKAVVEAFPNLFLGTLCDERDYPARPAKNRKWTDTLYPIVAGRLFDLLTHLLPRREIRGSWTLDDHEEIAGFTCAVTALCVAAGQFTAVGSTDDGWIILPPKSFLGRGWDTTLTVSCRKAQRAFPAAAIQW